MWRIEFTKKAEKQFQKLDPNAQQTISDYLDNIIKNKDPYAFGKALVGNFSGFWRYRVGKYRIICEIYDKKLLIEIISLGKRDKIYD